jgi:hypothetical protein
MFADKEPGVLPKWAFVCLTDSPKDGCKKEHEVKRNEAEDFKTKTADGGLIIAAYKGETLEPAIPAHIGGVKITGIGEEAFAWRGLTGVAIPSGVASIADRAFAGNRLTGVTIPSGVASIGQFAFFCNELSSLALPAGLLSIAWGAFAENHLTSATFGDGLISIGGGAFAGNRLTNIAFPPSIASVGRFAFFCNELKNIAVGAGVKIDAHAVDRDFAAFYDDNGRKAGVYANAGGVWRIQTERRKK